MKNKNSNKINKIVKTFRILSASIAFFVFPSLSYANCSMKVGVVPQFEQRRILTTWTPFLSEISKKTNCSFEIIGSSDIPSFEMKVNDGVFDLAFMNPYHSVVAHQTQGYLPLVRSGSKLLQGVLVVRSESGIVEIDELNGKEVAFPSPNALGASLLMRTELERTHGVKIIPKYVATHSSVYLHVFKELTLAGGGIERTLNAQEDVLKDGLRILYKTTAVAAHPIVAHPRVNQVLQTEIQQAILEISSEHPELLEGITVRNPIEASLKDYEVLSTLGLEDFASK